MASPASAGARLGTLGARAPLAAASAPRPARPPALRRAGAADASLGALGYFLRARAGRRGAAWGACDSQPCPRCAGGAARAPAGEGEHGGDVDMRSLLAAAGLVFRARPCARRKPHGGAGGAGAGGLLRSFPEGGRRRLFGGMRAGGEANAAGREAGIARGYATKPSRTVQDSGASDGRLQPSAAPAENASGQTDATPAPGAVLNALLDANLTASVSADPIKSDGGAAATLERAVPGSLPGGGVTEDDDALDLVVPTISNAVVALRSAIASGDAMAVYAALEKHLSPNSTPSTVPFSAHELHRAVLVMRTHTGARRSEIPREAPLRALDLIRHLHPKDEGTRELDLLRLDLLADAGMIAELDAALKALKKRAPGVQSSPRVVEALVRARCRSTAPDWRTCSADWRDALAVFEASRGILRTREAGVATALEELAEACQYSPEDYRLLHTTVGAVVRSAMRVTARTKAECVRQAAAEAAGGNGALLAEAVGWYGTSPVEVDALLVAIRSASRGRPRRLAYLAAAERLLRDEAAEEAARAVRAALSGQAKDTNQSDDLEEWTGPVAEIVDKLGTEAVRRREVGAMDVPEVAAEARGGSFGASRPIVETLLALIGDLPEPVAEAAVVRLLGVAPHVVTRLPVLGKARAVRRWLAENTSVAADRVGDALTSAPAEWRTAAETAIFEAVAVRLARDGALAAAESVVAAKMDVSAEYPLAVCSMATMDAVLVAHMEQSEGLDGAMEWARRVMQRWQGDFGDDAFRRFTELCSRRKRTEELVELMMRRWQSVVRITTPDLEAAEIVKDLRPPNWVVVDARVGAGRSNDVVDGEQTIITPLQLPLPLLQRRVTRAVDAHLHRCQRQQDVISAMRAFRRLLQAGIQPALSTHVLVIRALAQKPNANIAYQIFKRARALYSLAWAVEDRKALADWQSPKAIWKLLRRSNDRMLMRHWLDAVSEAEASEFSELLMVTLTALSRATPSNLIDDNIGATWKTLEGLSLRKDQPVRVTVEHCARLLYYYTRARDAPQVQNTLQLIREKCSVDPDSSSEVQFTLVLAYARMREVDLAKQHYLRCLELYGAENRKVPSNAYNAIIDAYVKLKDFGQVRWWLDERASVGGYGEHDPAVVNSLMKGYFVAGQVAEAVSVFEKAKEAKAANINVKSTFVRYAFSRGDYKRGFEVLREMSGRVGALTYHAIIAILIARGQWEEAMDLLREAIQDLSAVGGMGLAKLVSSVLWSVSGGVKYDMQGGSPADRDYQGAVGMGARINDPSLVGAGTVAPFRELPVEFYMDHRGVHVVPVEEAVRRLESVLGVVKGVQYMFRSRDTNLVIRLCARTVLEVVDRARLQEARRIMENASNPFVDRDSGEDVTPESVYSVSVDGAEDEDVPEKDEMEDVENVEDEDSNEGYLPPSAYMARMRDVATVAIQRQQKLSFPAIRYLLTAVAVESRDADLWKDVLQYLAGREMRLTNRWAEARADDVDHQTATSLVSEGVKQTILELAESRMWTAALKLWTLVSRCEVPLAGDRGATAPSRTYPLLHYVLGEPTWAHETFFRPLLATMGDHPSAMGHLHWLMKSCVNGPHPYPLHPDSHIAYLHVLGKNEKWADLLDAASGWAVPGGAVVRRAGTHEDVAKVLREAQSLLEKANRLEEAERLRQLRSQAESTEKNRI